MTPKVSIIIPVYKTEQYLRECLDSVLVQTYTDWECLLIDDGSPDDCGAICDEYVSRDSRFRVFHKENGGVSSARNVGLDNCVGEYVTFVDSDDTIAPDYLEAVNDFEGDLMILGYDCSDGTPAKPINNGIYVDSKLKQLISLYLLSGYLRSPWAKIFKRSVICEIRFDTSMCFAEDSVFCMAYLRRCNVIKVDTSYVYKYLLDSSGKDYWIQTPELGIYSLKAEYEQYKELGKPNSSFIHLLYYVFRGMVFRNKDGVQLWFNDDVIKEIYVENIHSEIFFHLSHFRWWITSIFK